MSRTRFKNASGLHHRRQVSSARDMAVLARHLMKNYPKYYPYFATREFTYRGHTYANHNKLLGKYPGMDGLKTGYISKSGFNLAASAKRNGHRIIGVVFGGRSSRTRNAHMVDLLNRGFKKLNRIRIARNTSPKIPLPKRKPLNDLLLASMEASLGSSEKEPEDKLSRLLGQGDIDPEVTRRLETGLLAMAAHTGRSYEVQGVGQYGGRKNLSKSSEDHWSIQVGAFASPGTSNIALKKAILSLPPELRDIHTEISTARTSAGSVYRARLVGFNQNSAQEACAYLIQCMIVSPKKR